MRFSSKQNTRSMTRAEIKSVKLTLETLDHTQNFFRQLN